MIRINSLAIALAAAIVLSGRAGGDIEPTLIPRPVIETDQSAAGIHLTPSGGQLVHADGAGFVWGISPSNGSVPDGSGDAYDGGMVLTVNGQDFGGGQTVFGNNGQEMEIGPWQLGHIMVWRRIYIDQEVGYCRWIDIFQNAADEPVTVSVLHKSDLGGSTREAYPVGGIQPGTGASVNWAMATDDGPPGNRPALAHIWGAPNGTTFPTVSAPTGTDEMTFVTQLELDAGETAAICIYQAQRVNMNDARQFVDDFDYRAETARIPPALLQIIVNFQTNMLIAGQLALPRFIDVDVVMLLGARQLTGTLLNEQFIIDASYGTITLPADRVIGLGRIDPSDPQVHVALVDGQVVAGRLTSGPVQLRLANGTSASVPVDRLASAAFAVSEAKPAEAALAAASIELRSGERLIFVDGPAQFEYFTEHGQLSIPADQLQAIDLTAAQGRLHRAVFTNGSQLSGLLTDGQLDFALQLGPHLAVSQDILANVDLALAPTDQAGAASMTLRNNDVLFGALADGTIEVETSYGPVTVATRDIARIAAPQDAQLGQVSIALADGTDVSGRMMSDGISFEIAPGVAVDVFIGYVSEVMVPRPPAEADVQPRDQPGEGDDEAPPG